MIPLSKPNFLKRKPRTVLLGLSLDGSRLEGALVRLQSGSLQLVQSFTATLALDPLTSEPELVGREVLNHLEAAGIRERYCTVAVPLKWALTAHTTLPDMPEADEDNFLKIEAERNFSSDTATLRMAISRFTSPSGIRHATFVGIPAAHLQRLEQALRAAKLKPGQFLARHHGFTTADPDRRRRAGSRPRRRPDWPANHLQRRRGGIADSGWRDGNRWRRADG